MRAGLHLDARLSCIAELIGSAETVADIGCDHGRLGAYLLQKDIARRVVFTDISEPSLEKARQLVERLWLADRAVFGVGDGAFALREAPDAAVIAGMGGETMAGVIERGQAILRDARLVLQPGLDHPILRRALADLGYRIADERIVRAAGRLYIAILAERGTAEYSPEDLVIGPVLRRERPALLGDFAAFRIRVLKKALAGAEAGGDEASAAQAREELRIWEDNGPWQ